jgi:hypothetical protein
VRDVLYVMNNTPGLYISVIRYLYIETTKWCTAVQTIQYTTQSCVTINSLEAPAEGIGNIPEISQKIVELN